MATATLPAANSYSEGKDITVSNNRLTTLDDLTVSCAGADTLGMAGSPTSFVLKPGECLSLVTDGTNKWYPKYDCSPAPELQSNPVGATQVIPQTPGLAMFPGTQAMLSYPGLYGCTVSMEIVVAGILATQPWDITFGVYNVTDATWLYTWVWSGVGAPLSNPKTNYHIYLDLPATDMGDQLQLACNRLAAYGTLTMQTTSFMQLLGPI